MQSMRSRGTHLDSWAFGIFRSFFALCLMHFEICALIFSILILTRRIFETTKKPKNRSGRKKKEKKEPKGKKNGLCSEQKSRRRGPHQELTRDRPVLEGGWEIPGGPGEGVAAGDRGVREVDGVQAVQAAAGRDVGVLRRGGAVVPPRHPQQHPLADGAAVLPGASGRAAAGLRGGGGVLREDPGGVAGAADPRNSLAREDAVERPRHQAPGLAAEQLLPPQRLRHLLFRAGRPRG